MSGVDARASFDFVRYASVWEDADVLCQALTPVAGGKRLLSIASAGDNALALLTLDPAEVVAVDLNPAQLACIDLRRVAFSILEYEDLLAFLGVVADAKRLAVYQSLRSAISQDTRTFWDARPEAVVAGIIHDGKFERYFATFRTRVLPWVHGADTIKRLRESGSIEEQRAFYRDHWDTWRWRGLFRVFFSRFVMGRLGRDPAFFDHVEGSVATRILERTRYALTELPVVSNPYLSYILTGNFQLNALPLYLRRSAHGCIRERIDRLRIVRAPADEVEGPFHGFNLSDIFEYMAPAEHERVYGRLIDHAEPGARLVYWNMLAPRARPIDEHRVVSLDELAGQLHAGDKAWFYQRLIVDEVVPLAERHA